MMAAEGTYRIMGIDHGANYMGYGVLEVEGRTVCSVVLGDIDLPSKRLDATDGMAVALCHYFTIASPLTAALGGERGKGLGGGKKAALTHGFGSWEKFLRPPPRDKIRIQA